jgi:hypothetical protein
MNRRFRFGTLLVSLLAAYGSNGQTVVEREATVYVSATSGNPATRVSLAAPELTLLVGGRSAPIVRVTPSPDVSLAALIDVTDSVSEAMASFVWDGQGSLSDVRPSGSKPPDSPADLFLQPFRRGVLRLLTPQDRILFGRVADPPELSDDFVSGAEEEERQIRWLLDPPTVIRYGASPLWDATASTIDALERETGRRRAVLLVTDGLSSGNRLGLDEVIDRAARLNVAVFVIGESWGTPRSPRGWGLRDSTAGPWFTMRGPFAQPFDHLKRLAASTGGEFIPDGVGRPDPEVAFRQILTLLRSTYAVTFRSPLLPGETADLEARYSSADATIHIQRRYRQTGMAR